MKGLEQNQDGQESKNYPPGQPPDIAPTWVRYYPIVKPHPDDDENPLFRGLNVRPPEC